MKTGPHWQMYTSICWYLRVSPVLHRPEVVDIGVNTIYKHAICLKDYIIRSFLSIWQAHGDLCNQLGIDSSTNLDDQYSNIFLNAYINRRAHTEYLNMIAVYSPLGIWHAFLCSINTNIYHFRSMKYRQYT